MAGDGVAVFAQAVGSMACGEAVQLVAGPAPGCWSHMIYLAATDAAVVPFAVGLLAIGDDAPGLVKAMRFSP